MGPASIHLGGLQNGLGTSNMNVHPTNEECGIREVWAHNLEEEFGTICQVCAKLDFCNIQFILQLYKFNFIILR